MEGGSRPCLYCVCLLPLAMIAFAAFAEQRYLAKTGASSPHAAGGTPDAFAELRYLATPNLTMISRSCAPELTRFARSDLRAPAGDSVRLVIGAGFQASNLPNDFA